MVISDRFFCLDERYCTLLKPLGSPIFRHAFALEDIPSSFELTVCGLGVYELYLNGERVSKGYLSPYRNNPDHFLYYDHYQLATKLRKGKNVVALALGNGILSTESPVWGGNGYSWRGAPRFALSAEIEGTVAFDGSVFVGSRSEVIFNDWHCSEHIDLRLRQKGWKDVDFDDSSWAKVQPASGFSGEKKLCSANPVKPYKEVRPQRHWKGERGYIFDFALSGAGTYRLKIKGEAGQRLDLYFNDCVIEGKRISNKNLYCWSLDDDMAKQAQHDVLILDGEVDEVEPVFTFKGFRFIEIVGLTEEQSASLELVFVMFSSASIAGSITTDNEVINALQDCVIQSDRSNFIFYPLDCPQREKNGWTGDAALSAEQFLLNLDCAPNLLTWLENLVKTQKENGALPGIVPTEKWGYEWGNGPGWDLSLFELPYRIYLYTGETKAIGICLSAMRKYLAYMTSKRDERGMFAYGLEDWLPINTHTPLEVTDTLLCFQLAKTAAYCFRAIGEREDARKAFELAKEIRDAFRRVVLRPDNDDGPWGSYNTVTTHAMALGLGMYEEDELALGRYRFRDRLRQVGDRLDFGAIGNRYFFRAAADCFGIDYALKAMIGDQYPSYKRMLGNGATTLWEGFMYFDGDMANVPEHMVNGSWSFNHHFLGDVSSVFYRYLAGIRVEGPLEVVFSPDFASDVHSLTAYHDFPLGRMEVRIEHDRKEATAMVLFPVGMKGKVLAPKGYSADKEVLNPGMNIIRFIRCSHG